MEKETRSYDADTCIEYAKIAQRFFADASQERVDAVVQAICRVVYENAEELSRRAVEETMMGNCADKIAKCTGKSQLIWHDLKDRKTVGVINEIKERGIVEIAKPVGVVAGITPCTNPVVTVMSNAAFALKCRNAIIFAPHPRAVKLTDYMMNLFHAELEKLGEPVNLIQACEICSVEDTQRLMRGVDVVVATGGYGMVHAAYSSGKPAYGVGAGNVQCLIDTGVDYEKVTELITGGRCFDYGILCTCEQAVMIPESEDKTILKAFVKAGAYIIDSEDEKEALRRAMFPDGKTINRDIVGKPAEFVAQIAGIKVPEGTRVIVVELQETGAKELLSKEKMCPVLALYKYQSFEEGVEIACQNLANEGMGHSACLYTNDEDHVSYFGERVNVSRIVLNHSSANGAGGNVWNGFTPTNTLGCGSWGNNSISDNFTYKYLMNTTRIGRCLDKPLELRSEDLIGTK